MSLDYISYVLLFINLGGVDFFIQGNSSTRYNPIFSHAITSLYTSVIFLPFLYPEPVFHHITPSGLITCLRETRVLMQKFNQSSSFLNLVSFPYVRASK